MAKIYFQPALLHSTTPSSSSSTCSDYVTSKQEVFTIWMKSLMFNCNGFTVFNSSGQIIYRIDNYDSKCNTEVFLMDLEGKVIFTILKKKLRLFGEWEGYRCNSSMLERGKPWFRVRKPFVLRGKYTCEVTVTGWDKDKAIYYKIEGLVGGAAYKIVDASGGLVAEVKQKQSTSGIMLGDDVLSLVVGPGIDHSLVMGLVVVYSLINHNM